MARIRSIHPDACKSRKLARLSPEAERCFWRLQVHCDDDGRCEDDPQLLAALLFSMQREVTADDMDGWLFELAEVGLIVRYGDDEPALSVHQFRIYQKPRHPQESKLPEPPHQGIPAFRRNGTAECGNAPAGVVGVVVEGDNRNVRRHTPAERKRLLTATASIVAERRHLPLHAKTKQDPDRWLAAAVNGIGSDIADDFHELLTEAPDATPEQLADYFQAVEPLIEPARAMTYCDDCGWNRSSHDTPHTYIHAEWIAEESA